MKTKIFPRIVIVIVILALALPTGVLAAPSNDNFVDAQPIAGLPFSVNVDTSGATFEASEPYPSCGYRYPLKTAWFAFTPSTSATLVAQINYYYFPTLVAVYRGNALSNLTRVACGLFYNTAAFQAQAGVD